MVNTFVFMGRPGSGKGVQSKLLAEKLGCTILSTGGRVREIAEEDTALGKKIKEISEAGINTPSWFASFLFEEALLKLKDDEGIIFEGLGKKEPESRLFAEITKFLERDFRVIFIDVSEESIRGRIAKRALIEGRKDDGVLDTRLGTFYKDTMPSVDFFRSLGKVIDIDGEPSPEEIHADIWQKVSSL